MAFDLSIFNPGARPLLGLDVSSSAVKLVELSRTAKGEHRIERYATENLPRDSVVDGNIAKLEDVADAVRRAWKRMGTSTRNVALALPAAAVITKKIIVPANQREQELEVLVESEANQYIPFQLDEVNLDFQVVGPAPGSPDEVEVLIAASRKEKVSDRQGLAEAAGLKPVVMDVESYASRLAASRVIETLPNQGVDSLVALLEIGSLTTSLQVIRNDEVLYERDQAFGGSQLTQLIVRQYGFSADEAEAKKRSGELPEDYRQAVLEPFIESMSQEIGRALQFFFTSTPHNKVDYILLSGGSAGLPGLPLMVTGQTSFPCKLINPFEGMKLGAGINTRRLESEATSYLVAAGLALRRFYQ